MKPPIPGQPHASGHKVYVLLDPRFPRDDGSDGSPHDASRAA